MARLLVFIAAIMSLSFGAVWLADRPGDVIINWMGWRIETSFAFLMLLLALVTLVCFFVYSTLLWLLKAPKHFSTFLQVKSETRGIEAVTGAFAAIALADAPTAARQIRAAERYLGKHPLTMMLSAQLARQNGDEPHTRELLEEMLNHKETARLAVKGLTEYARSHGDLPAALGYAEQAIAQMPGDRTVVMALVDLYTRQGRWQEAEAAIDKGQRKRAFTRADANRLRALVLFEQASNLSRDNQISTAIKQIERAIKRQPDFVPATLLLAELLVDKAKPEAAARALERCWKLVPHMQLMDMLLELLSDGNNAKTLKRIEKLARLHPDAAASHLAVAEAAMRADAWETARHRLNLVLQNHPTASACLAMAELEKEQYANLQAATEWTRKTASAHADPVWLCGECGTVHEHWQLHCKSCQAFDSINWNRPGLRYLQTDPKMDDIKKTG